jgi:hypothetical protein
MNDNDNDLGFDPLKLPLLAEAEAAMKTELCELIVEEIESLAAAFKEIDPTCTINAGMLATHILQYIVSTIILAATAVGSEVFIAQTFATKLIADVRKGQKEMMEQKARVMEQNDE